MKVKLLLDFKFFVNIMYVYKKRIPLIGSTPLLVDKLCTIIAKLIVILLKSFK